MQRIVTSNLTLKTLFVFVLISLVSATKFRTCYNCQGINCMRTTLNSKQQCTDPLDYCVTVFSEFNVVHKSCSLQTPIELRKYCDANSAECHKCNGDLCNNLGQVNYQCIQCDSSKDANCAQNATTLTPMRCASPTSFNSYCYVKYDNNVTKRGCASTTVEQLSCNSDEKCLLCLPGDIKGCNSIDFTPGTQRKFFSL